MNQLTLFAEAFHVNPIRSLVDVPEPTTSATSGQSSSDVFARLDPDGLWQKTSAGCCQVTLDGSSETFSETWPRAGMTRSGTAYLRPPLAPLTNGIASGLWPTPGANDYKGSSRVGQRRGQLDEAIESMPAWIPCPCCENFLCLIHLLHAHECACPSVDEWSSDPYTDRAPGRLAPMFSEWLLGFPIGWTVCGPSETRLSRRSRNGSRDGLRKRTSRKKKVSE